MFNQAVKAAIPHTKRAKQSILKCVRVMPGYVLASDAYTLVRSTYTTPNDVPPGGFLLSVADAREVAKMKVVTVSMHVDGRLVVMTSEGVSYYKEHTGSPDYPDYERLINDFVPSEKQGLQIKMEDLAKLTPAALARNARQREQVVTFRFGKTATYFDFGGHTEGLISNVYATGYSVREY